LARGSVDTSIDSSIGPVPDLFLDFIVLKPGVAELDLIAFRLLNLTLVIELSHEAREDFIVFLQHLAHFDVLKLFVHLLLPNLLNDRNQLLLILLLDLLQIHSDILSCAGFSLCS
jgi:hypothetical protein